MRRTTPVEPIEPIEPIEPANLWSRSSLRTFQQERMNDQPLNMIQ